MEKAFEDPPGPYRAVPFPKRLELWRLGGRAKREALARLRWSSYVQDAAGDSLMQWRDYRRRAASFRDVLPNLDAALLNYRRMLEATVTDIRKAHARPILMTQPAMWRPGLSPSQTDLLWMGGVGDFQASAGHDYYTVNALAQGLDRFNRTLLDVCRETGAECIDLAAQMSGDVSSFFDDVHFSDDGSRRVAGIVADHIVQQLTTAASTR
jgi:hypothetical protein